MLRLPQQPRHVGQELKESYVANIEGRNHHYNQGRLHDFPQGGDGVMGLKAPSYNPLCQPKQNYYSSQDQEQIYIKSRAVYMFTLGFGGRGGGQLSFPPP